MRTGPHVIAAPWRILRGEVNSLPFVLSKDSAGGSLNRNDRLRRAELVAGCRQILLIRGRSVIAVDPAEKVGIRAENDGAWKRLNFEDLSDLWLFIEIKMNRNEVLVDEPSHVRCIDGLLFELFAVRAPVCTEHHHDRLVLCDGDFACFFQVSLPFDSGGGCSLSLRRGRCGNGNHPDCDGQ